MDGVGQVDQEMIAEIQRWCTDRRIRLCVLFGSQATGRTRADSDVDLALWPGVDPEPLALLKWVGELERLVGRAVSIVLVTPRLDPVLGREIGRDGIVLYMADSDPELWIKERLRLWHLYNDALPFLRRQREALLAYAEEVRRGA